MLLLKAQSTAAAHPMHLLKSVEPRPLPRPTHLPKAPSTAPRTCSKPLSPAARPSSSMLFVTAATTLDCLHSSVRSVCGMPRSRAQGSR